MQADSDYIRYTKFILAFVFVVILAGGVVRTTQSGMGCPDWPRCFGMWIPPVHASQLPPDYEKYLNKQDIDHSFNVYHTWIEYINRLLGASLGLFIIIHLIWSFKKFFTTDRSIFWMSSFFLIITAFEGWLGKTVVDTNLAVVKITLHMLAALAIAAIPVVILNRLKRGSKTNDSKLKWITVAALTVLIMQIILGTEVREQIDEISKSFGYSQRGLWISRLNYFFDIHKAFSVVATLFCMLVFWQSLGHMQLQKKGTGILIIVICILVLGFIMSSFNIPAFAQPLHVLLSAILFIQLFDFRLQLK